jgi:signal transduction histidine kinase
MDRESWARFARYALPEVFRRKSPTDAVRAWVPSCSDGVAFGVALGLLREARKRGLRGPIRVIGSADRQETVRVARLGRVSRAAAERLPTVWAGDHLAAFDRHHLQADTFLRRHLVFSRHELGRDPPFAQLDLVFAHGLDAPEALRERIADHFWFALRDEGVLWLEGTSLRIDAERFDRIFHAPNGFRRQGRGLRRAAIDALIADAIADERVRLGEELHDTVGQHVAAASLMLHRVKKESAAPRSPVFRELEKTLAAARNDLRAIARGQLPIEIVGADLPAALRDTATTLTQLLGVEVVSTAEGAFDWVDPVSAGHLVRIAQEAARNAAAAGARHVGLKLRDGPADLRLGIFDDGGGLAPSSRKRVLGEGLGLHIMRYRARVIGASLRFSAVGKGTAVECVLPRPSA